MNIILDTNILLSASFSDTTTPAKVLHLVLQKHTLLVSSKTYAELEQAIWRKKFDSYITKDKRKRFLKTFLKDAKLNKVIDKIQACRDPKDNMILELAVSGQADCIVTGDKDLLALNPFRGIQILTPAEFLKLKK